MNTKKLLATTFAAVLLNAGGLALTAAHAEASMPMQVRASSMGAEAPAYANPQQWAQGGGGPMGGGQMGMGRGQMGGGQMGMGRGQMGGGQMGMGRGPMGGGQMGMGRGMMGGGPMGMMGDCPMMGASNGLNGKVMMQMHGEMLRAMGDIMMKYADQFETPPATE